MQRSETSASWIVLPVLGVLLMIVIVAGVTYEQVGGRRDRERLPHIGRSVDLGGRTLNIYCSGAGRPAVILESGASEQSCTNTEYQVAAMMWCKCFTLLTLRRRAGSSGNRHRDSRDRRYSTNISIKVPRTLALRGTAAQTALAQWLVDELDKSTGGYPLDQPGQTSVAHEYRVPGNGDDLVRVFYLTHTETPQGVQENAR